MAKLKQANKLKLLALSKLRKQVLLFLLFNLI